MKEGLPKPPHSFGSRANKLSINVLRLLLSGLGIVLGLLIEFVLAILPAERILFALIHTGGGSLVLVYLLSTNWVFSHDFVLSLTPPLGPSSQTRCFYT
jgi:hypothetical protein